MDCNENGSPDHWDILYGISYDCDGDGIPDECGDDCNLNGIADSCDLDPSDPDGNGLVSEDCNFDGVPDECLWTIAHVILDSDELSPIGSGSPQSFVIADLHEVLEDVTLSFTAYADLSSAATEWIDVSINGTDIGEIFREDASDCPVVPDEAELTVPMALFNSLIAGGQDALITMTASDDVNSNACDGQSYITVSFSCQALWDGTLMPVELSSEEMSPIGYNSPQSYTIAGAPSALGDVALTITAHADLKMYYEWIDLDINGTWIAMLFENEPGDCLNPPSEARVIVSSTVFNDAVGPGQDAVITMTPSEDVSDSACGGDSYIAVSVSYEGLWRLDQNGNGIIDECECLSDLNGDDKVNIDDLFQILGAWGTCDGWPEDLNFDGKVNIDDLFQILGAWGTCDGCPEDLNFDGKVNIDDLFFILGHWGPCPD